MREIYVWKASEDDNKRSLDIVSPGSALSIWKNLKVKDGIYSGCFHRYPGNHLPDISALRPGTIFRILEALLIMEETKAYRNLWEDTCLYCSARSLGLSDSALVESQVTLDSGPDQCPDPEREELSVFFACGDAQLWRTSRIYSKINANIDTSWLTNVYKGRKRVFFISDKLQNASTSWKKSSERHV